MHLYISDLKSYGLLFYNFDDARAVDEHCIQFIWCIRYSIRPTSITSTNKNALTDIIFPFPHCWISDSYGKWSVGARTKQKSVYAIKTNENVGKIEWADHKPIHTFLCWLIQVVGLRRDNGFETLLQARSLLFECGFASIVILKCILSATAQFKSFITNIRLLFGIGITTYGLRREHMKIKNRTRWDFKGKG